MTLSVGRNVADSFEFAENGLSIKKLILLIALGIIPFLNFIVSGYLVKMYKGVDTVPELEGYGRMLIDGIKLCIIWFVYSIIPVMLISSGHSILQATGLILAFFIGMFAIIAGIRFAKTGKIIEGFNITAILEKIEEIGSGRYILAYSVCFVIVVVTGIMAGMIPFYGWFAFLIIMPFLLVWQGKFLENLYSLA